MLCGTDQCTGCGACYNTCPHNCIEMELNEGGGVISYCFIQLCRLS